MRSILDDPVYITQDLISNDDQIKIKIDEYIPKEYWYPRDDYCGKTKISVSNRYYDKTEYSDYDIYKERMVGLNENQIEHFPVYDSCNPFNKMTIGELINNKEYDMITKINGDMYVPYDEKLVCNFTGSLSLYYVCDNGFLCNHDFITEEGRNYDDYYFLRQSEHVSHLTMKDDFKNYFEYPKFKSQLRVSGFYHHYEPVLAYKKGESYPTYIVGYRIADKI